MDNNTIEENDILRDKSKQYNRIQNRGSERGYVYLCQR